MRGLDNTLKLWLHGYLGQFFHFTVMGFLSWLMLPVYFYILLNGRILRKEVVGSILFIFLFAILVSVKGFFNHRYIITLLPIYTVLVFLFVGSYFKKRIQFVNPYKPLFTFALFCSLSILSFSFISNNTQYDWNALKNKYYLWVASKAKAKKKIRKSLTPFESINFLRDIKIETNVFVNELPIFYYLTDLKGVYYNPLYDFYYTANGKVNLLENRTDDQVVDYITDSLHCKYIFTSESKNRFNSRFEKILKQNYDTLSKDSYYLLYVLKEDS
jgi:hypothetical protein